MGNLTPQDMVKFFTPFQPNEHSFKPRNKADKENGRGAAYINEYSIMIRIRTIDPNAEIKFSEPTWREDRCVIKCWITVKGLTVEDYGNAVIRTNDAGDEVNEPEKAAATDSFKRAARKLGIGSYLTSMGDDVNNPKTLLEWLTDYSSGLWRKHKAQLLGIDEDVKPEPQLIQPIAIQPEPPKQPASVGTQQPIPFPVNNDPYAENSFRLVSIQRDGTAHGTMFWKGKIEDDKGVRFPVNLWHEDRQSIALAGYNLNWTSNDLVTCDVPVTVSKLRGDPRINHVKSADGSRALQIFGSSPVVYSSDLQPGDVILFENEFDMPKKREKARVLVREVHTDVEKWFIRYSKLDDMEEIYTHRIRNDAPFQLLDIRKEACHV